MKVKETTIVQVIGHAVMIIFAVAAVLPFLLMIAASFTDSGWATANGFSFFPEEWSLEAYQYIANQWQTIGQAYLMTFIVTIVGTALSLLVVCLFAYGVSHTDYPGMKFPNFICVFTMLFNGGIVTTYYVWTNYFNIRNSFWALVLPNLLMSAFNVMLVKNYFKFSILESLLEAARMAIAVVGILPILIAYPFFQRFFVKGIMLGGVKE